MLLFIAASFAVYCPIFAGYIPFPADLVTSFPPWEGTPERAFVAGMTQPEMGDLVTAYYPWRSRLNTTFLKPGVPLWNHQILMGTPYQPEPMSALFFPLNWLYSVLSAPFAWAWSYPIHTAIIAITTALYARRLGLSRAGIVVAAAAFACCGWVAADQGRIELDSAMWLPLTFFAVDWLHTNPSRRAVACGAIAFALPVLGGHPEIAMHVIWVTVMYAIYRAFPIRRETRGFIAAFSAAGILAVLLAAVQIVPTAEWLGHIPRTLDLRWPTLPSIQSLAFLSRDVSHSPNVDGIVFPGGAMYFGGISLAVLPFALLWHRRRDVIFFAVLAFAMLEIAYGWQPFYSISQHIPIIAGLPNIRLLVEAEFAVAILAGMSVSALQLRAGAVKPYSSTAAWIAGVPVVAIGCALVVARIAGLRDLSWRWSLPIVGAGFLLAAMAAARRIRPEHFVRLALFLLITDLLSYSAGLSPFVRRAYIYPDNPTFNFLRRQADQNWRVAAVDVTYGSTFEMPYGLLTAAGLDFVTSRTSRFLSTFSDNPAMIQFVSFHFSSKRLLEAPKGAANLTGVRFYSANTWNSSAASLAAHPERFERVFQSGSVQVFENKEAFPLAFFLPTEAVRIEKQDEGQIRAILSEDFDPRRTAIVPAPLTQYAGHSGPAADRSVDRVTLGQNTIDVAMKADQDGLLVVNETEYPGWSAKVDDGPAPLVRANYAFMGVPLSRGPHIVRLSFLPDSFRIGAALSGAGVLALLFLLFPAKLARRDDVLHTTN